ncbi:MAG: hypothetical protein Kow0058_02550 [Roseovarius sp.]
MKTSLLAACATAAALLATPLMASDDDNVVKVSLKEWDLGFKAVKIDGDEAVFEVVNDGQMTHAFELEGKIGGHKIEFRTGDLKPGERTRFKVELPAGAYEVYCPIDGHEENGMKGTITFAEE